MNNKKCHKISDSEKIIYDLIKSVKDVTSIVEENKKRLKKQIKNILHYVRSK